MKKIPRSIPYILLPILLFSCFLMGFQLEDKPGFSKEEKIAIEEEINLRIATFVRKEKKECREELMEKVDDKVDSILMFDFDAQKLLFGDDTTIIKPKPTKPQIPELIQPNDDTPLEPLIKDEKSIIESSPTTQPHQIETQPNSTPTTQPRKNE